MWGLIALAKGRQINQQILVDNAERYLRLAEEREKENVALRERIKGDEINIQSLEARYSRLMRRYVAMEDRMKEVEQICHDAKIQLPPGWHED